MAFVNPDVAQAICIAAVGLAALLGIVMFFHSRAAPPRRVAVRKIHAEVSDDRDEPRVRSGGGHGRASGERFDRREDSHDEPEVPVPPVIKMPGRPKGEGRRRNAEMDAITNDLDTAGRTTAAPEATVRAEDVAPPAPPSADHGKPGLSDFDRPPLSNGRNVATLPAVAIGAAPLICVTGSHARLPLLPVDGVCDFAIFRDIIFGDNEWVSASSRSKLDTYLHEAEKSTSTTFLLSFPAKMRRELVPFLSSPAAIELIRSYSSRGIRGYGFARAEIAAEQLHNVTDDYSTVLKLLNSAMKSAVPTSGISFIGIFLRAIKNSKGAVLPFPTEIASNVNLFIAISHTPVLPPNDCKVEPTSSWTQEHINDFSLPSLMGTLEMLRDGRNLSATFAMSLTMGVLDYRVSTAGLAGIDGTWNVACSHSELEPFEQTCRNPLTRGTVGADDLIVYDFSKKTKTWRSFETTESIMAKLRKCYQLMRTAGFATFGWAMYDVDLEDHSTACVAKAHNEPSLNRIVQAKQLLKNMAASKAAGSLTV
ncbi:uncharacterized protein LOC125943490 [Dermacentor silvarum]|uniref:uncharacterized protein LOC125943490 n=1 Tax=Dermacentor silvarum TaxID=543639 RepID=UPI002100A3B3|nr:uncharacterized protein LOC125943490 [Dermacentor silvarum]